MLSTPDQAEIPIDVRYNTFARNSKFAQELLEKALIERPIKNIHSLEQPAVMQKIWTENDRASIKGYGKPIEQVISL
jgi:hypothetical protein